MDEKKPRGEIRSNNSKGREMRQKLFRTYEDTEELLPGEYPPLGAVCQEKPRAEGGYAVTGRFREAKEKGRKGGNHTWRRGSCEGCGELMKAGKESTGKGGSCQAGEQILPQKLTAAEEMHAHGCRML